MSKRKMIKIKKLEEYPDAMTVKETSEFLGVSTKTIYKLIQQKIFPQIMVGRSYRISKKFLLNYLECNCE